jgi:hypothetical protein
MDNLKNNVVKSVDLTPILLLASIYLCHRYSGARLKEIGAYFVIGESAVSQASRRFAIKMAKDDKLIKAMEKIEGELNVSRV